MLRHQRVTNARSIDNFKHKGRSTLFFILTEKVVDKITRADISSQQIDGLSHFDKPILDQRMLIGHAISDMENDGRFFIFRAKDWWFLKQYCYNHYVLVRTKKKRVKGIGEE